MGKFVKGNKGKPKGAKSLKTIQWEVLHEDIISTHSEGFNRTLNGLLSSPDIKVQQAGCDLFLQVLEYFKPKQSRITHLGDMTNPVQIIISKDL